MNNVKTRMQALGLLDRAFKAATDDELDAAVATLEDDHREALEQFVDGDPGADGVRAGVRAGRIDGGMEAIAAVVSDACLSDCIEALGDNAENPTTDQLREVLPGLVERHGVGMTRIMLAATVAGEAPAAAIIRDLLKHDELVALPKAEAVQPVAPIDLVARRSDSEQAELREKRRAARQAKQDAERARRAQAAAAKRKQ